MAARLSRFHNGLVGLRSAFTMAEILLSLTIIGVVAAITLPSLTGNINERTWNTQRKALQSRLSQALALMPSLNGYGTLDETTDTAAETFVTNGLSKVLKINNICDNEHFEDCGFTSKITPLRGNSKIDLPKSLEELSSRLVGSASYNIDRVPEIINTKAAAFETVNGESIAVYYNPRCLFRTPVDTSGVWGANARWIPSLLCANFVYDLNGSKGPNTIGKDMGFMSAFYASDSELTAVFPTTMRFGDSKFGTVYSKVVKECRAAGYTVPNLYEQSSLFVNSNLCGDTDIGLDVGGGGPANGMGTSTYMNGKRMGVRYDWGTWWGTDSAVIRCVQR